MNRFRSVFYENGKRHETVGPAAYGAVNCLKRNELVKALAEALPEGTIRFGYGLVSANIDETSSFPILRFKDGRSIRAKVVIGCDGSNSVIADFLRMNPTRAFGSRAVRGFTSYPDGHGFQPEVVTMKMENVLCGRLPVTDRLVFWFTYFPHYSQQESEISRDREAIAELTKGSTKDLPEEWREMVKNCDVSSLYMSSIRYRPPWEILVGKFRRGTVTVAGDAMHLMGPFLGQGGCAALEDAVVLGRCLGKKLGQGHVFPPRKGMVEEAIDEYVRERRKRVFALSTQVYLTGKLVGASSGVAKVMLLVLLMVLFYDQIRHTRYDCGKL
ncbi:PREDICTED: uncharacterized protein LOC104802571 isoform X2 [Tarenaya hassleriana]|uniref:uncharacterized protein LOC104802571 isoform X2 n=1 Tax=Tarenaya hassleriana TaxID=28532 RepID=UPI00053C971A|nr:PREDICTED: uncharacterized protein LOC104802571 isoform X2 [Tarenaya hassleriana]